MIGGPSGGVTRITRFIDIIPDLVQHVITRIGLVQAPGATGVTPGPPAIVPASQCASVKFVNVSGTLPVFLTMILYSTVWPSLPVSSAVL